MDYQFVEEPIRIVLPENTEFQLNPHGAPNGLYVIPNWLTPQQEQEIVNFLCTGQWSDHISTKRPTQHFGYRYTISGYSSSTEKVAKDWGVLRYHADRIEHDFPRIKIAQCLANMYFRDTTIGAHRDRETPIVFGVSAVGDINMIWTRMDNENIKYEALIPARSLYIMVDDAALLWKHEVPPRKTVRYPDASGNLTITKKKPNDYCRVSITYRHFNGAMSGPNGTVLGSLQMPNTHTSQVSVLPPPNYTSPLPELPTLEACHLQGVIPKHLEKEIFLFNEHPWMKMFKRQACGGSHIMSRTSGIYGKWLEIFCLRILNCRIEIESCFANMYPNGQADLPAHSDKQYACWVIGLSFGETRTFDFILNGTKPKAKTGDITSIEMKSGDILLFGPSVNASHKHRILEEKHRSNRRINLTYFVKLVPMDATGRTGEKQLLDPPEIKAEMIPTFEEAEHIYGRSDWSAQNRQMLQSHGLHLTEMGQIGMSNQTPMLPSQFPGVGRSLREPTIGQPAGGIIITEGENGQLFVVVDGVMVPIDSMDDLAINMIGEQ